MWAAESQGQDCTYWWFSAVGDGIVAVLMHTLPCEAWISLSFAVLKAGYDTAAYQLIVEKINRSGSAPCPREIK
jgi:hypothetical protein